MSSHSPLRRTSSSARVEVEDPHRLLLEGRGVGVDLGFAEHRAQRRAPRGVADAGRVVADDQHDAVPGVLELAQLAQHDRMAEVDVGRRRVDPELDAQRPALGRGAARASRARAPAGSESTAPGQPGSFVGGRLGGVWHRGQC